MKSLVGALIQRTWYPYKRGNFRQMCMQAELHMHTQLAIYEHKPGGEAQNTPSLTALRRNQP